MKQIIQNISNGETILEEVPAPQVKPGSVLIQSSRSLVSLGTERMLVEFGKSNLFQKAKAQPERVTQVIDKIKTDGLRPTLKAVFNKLSQPIPLGYCNVGKVVAVGEGVTGFFIGDRVASNGPHAEFVCVSKNLVVKIPDDVSDDEAAFTVVGSIGLQGVRLVNPTFGETIVVIGLGLIGLITIELLKANGCKVIGVDFDEKKIAIAREKGIIAINPSQGTEPVSFILRETENIGADGVIITASTKSDVVISQAAQMSRQRGRIVLVGVVGLNMNRSEFYQKELTFQVSCSYGPGRYDENYEGRGLDYPIGFVRWTEKRNFETILNSISSHQLNVKPLISQKVKLEEYLQIYGDMKNSNNIASIIEYSGTSNNNKVIQLKSVDFKSAKGTIGVIGAGNYTSATVLPVIKSLDVNLKYIASAGGLTAKILAKKGGFSYATSDYSEVFKDKEVDLVLILTRHNLHAKMVVEGLNAGKNIFVEKPLALNRGELLAVIEAYQASGKTLTVGFNRRFAPMAVKMKKLLGGGPKNIVATMNAGMIPVNTWVQDMTIGGGRIIGEACHYIDLCSYLAGCKVTSVCMNSLGINPVDSTDNATIMLKYENGTNAVINYFANGSKSYAKERIEVFSQERVLVLDNWRKLTGFGCNGFSSMKAKMDKGHEAQFKLLIDRTKNGGEALISFDDIINTSIASLAAIESLREKRWVNI